MSVTIDVVYEGELKCAATHAPSGAVMKTDAPRDNGGEGRSFSPTDLVGTALGTCILTIMGLVAKRENINLTGTRMRVEKEMTKEGVRRIGQLTITVSFPKGLIISDDQKEKLNRTVASCPVRQSLHPDVKVIERFEYEKEL